MSVRSPLKRRALAVALTCSTSIFAIDAYAQDEQPGEGVQRERIVVTATRRNTLLQDSSISATVLSPQDLANKGADDLNGLQFAAPSVTIDQNGGANVFNIRGIGRERVDVEIPSGIVIYRDGAPTLAGYFQNEPFYDMAGIEVLRGPQGTLAGKNAAGGAVFIRTRSADLDGFAGYLQGGFGNYDLYELQGAVNLPLIEDELAMRVAYNHYQRDGFYDVTGPFTGHPDDKEYNSLRVSFYWEPTDSLEVTLKTELSHLDIGGYVATSYTGPLFELYSDAPYYDVDESMRTTLNISYHFGDGFTLNSVSAVQEFHTEFSGDLIGSTPEARRCPNVPVPPPCEAPAWFRASGNFHFYSQEFTLVSPDDRDFRWLVGLFAQRQLNIIPDFTQTGEYGFAFFGGPFFPNMDFPWLQSPWRLEEDDLAVFANFEFDFRDDLMLEIGGRLSYNDREQFVNFQFGDGTAPPVIPFGHPLGGARQETAGVYGDYKIALNWDATEDDLLYIQHSLGHVSKSINIFPPNRTYGRMEVYDFEVGWKGTVLDDQMTIQFDAFFETIANYQAVFGIASVLGGLVEARNAEGRSIIYGAEFAGQSQFDDLHFDFGVAYLHSELGTFRDVLNPHFTGIPPGGGLLVNPMTGGPLPADCQSAVAVLELTGAEAPFSPNWTGNVGVGYDIHTDTGLTITPRVDYAYIGESRATLFKCDAVRIPERDIMNVAINVVADNGWYFSIWSTNTLDNEYIAGIQNDGTLVTAGAPRQYGLRIGKSF
jgi:iron complex outermembrane receptor protein